MNMTRPELIAYVKKCMDEVTPYDETAQGVTTPPLPVYTMIDNNIDACLREYCLMAPIHRLPIVARDVSSFVQKSGKMTTALLETDNYLRFVRTEFESWPTQCTKAYSEHDTMCNQLFSKYSRPTTKKPIVVLRKNSVGVILDFYPFKSLDNGKVIFVQGNMDLSKYEDHNFWTAAWLIASRTFASLGEANGEKICYEKYGFKLQAENTV